jgi:hypothetical protein
MGTKAWTVLIGALVVANVAYVVLLVAFLVNRHG